MIRINNIYIPEVKYVLFWIGNKMKKKNLSGPALTLLVAAATKIFLFLFYFVPNPK